MPLAILPHHELIHNRLKEPQYINFPNRFHIPDNYILYNVNSDDIPFVLPALFIWVDLGLQRLAPETTSPSNILYLDSLFCDIPTRDFINKDIKYFNILMLSPNLIYNRAFLTKEQIDIHHETLKSYIPRFKEFFTGENRNG